MVVSSFMTESYNKIFLEKDETDVALPDIISCPILPVWFSEMCMNTFRAQV